MQQEWGAGGACSRPVGSWAEHGSRPAAPAAPVAHVLCTLRPGTGQQVAALLMLHVLPCFACCHALHTATTCLLWFDLRAQTLTMAWTTFWSSRRGRPSPGCSPT